MSRIGKKEVSIPEKVDVKLAEGTLTVKGPKGELNFSVRPELNINIESNTISVSPKSNDRLSRSLWGMTRTVVANMVQGVSAGFTKKLEYNGVGYKAVASGSTLNLSLGYSHPIEFKLPEGIAAKVSGNTIEISGASKELVGMTAAKVRSLREPEPYKGKGIKYSDEVIIRKAGKTGGKK